MLSLHFNYDHSKGVFREKKEYIEGNFSFLEIFLQFIIFLLLKAPEASRENLYFLYSAQSLEILTLTLVPSLTLISYPSQPLLSSLTFKPLGFKCIGGTSLATRV